MYATGFNRVPHSGRIRDAFRVHNKRIVLFILRPLQLINVVARGQTFTGMYRVSDGLLTIKFADHEKTAFAEEANAEAVARALLRSLLEDRFSSPPGGGP
jgi:hypothetical protein